MSNNEREKAYLLLTEYTKSPHLIKHSRAVEASMLWYADKFQQNQEEKTKWGICGLLHDFDYESHPDPSPPDGHPFFGCKILKEAGYSDDIIEAILGHANYSGVERKTLMAKVLFAVDEMSGFITACALVRPDKQIANVEVKSVLKKMKDKAFARGCNRDDMVLGAQEIDLPMEEHVKNVISALSVIQGELI